MRNVPVPRRPRWFLRSELSGGGDWLACARIPDGYFLRFFGLADFIVARDGRHLTCADRQSSTSADTMRHLLLDHVLPKVLHLHGRYPLHATAVLTPKGVCAFIGPTGAGKSTLAASLLLDGFPILSDDCLVLEARDEVLAYPGYPGTRLWADALKGLGHAGADSAPVAHYTSKKRLLGRNGLRFPVRPQPLARIYRLMWANGSDSREPPHAPEIEPLRPREAFMELAESSFRLDPDDRVRLAGEFRFFESIVTRIPISRLWVPDGFARLPAVRDAILADLAS